MQGQSKGLFKEKTLIKSEITMEVVQVSLAMFLCLENRPKIALNKY